MAGKSSVAGRWLNAQYAGECIVCRKKIEIGDSIFHLRRLTTMCNRCANQFKTYCREVRNPRPEKAMSIEKVKELRKLRDKYFQQRWSLASLRSVHIRTPVGESNIGSEVNYIGDVCKKADKKFGDVVGTAVKKAVKEMFDLAIREAEAEARKEAEEFLGQPKAYCSIQDKPCGGTIKDCSQRRDMTPAMMKVLEFIREVPCDSESVYKRYATWRSRYIDRVINNLADAGLIELDWGVWRAV